MGDVEEVLVGGTDAPGALGRPDDDVTRCVEEPAPAPAGPLGVGKRGDRVGMSNVGANGNVMSAAARFPNGSQISEGLNRNRSDADTTLTSTSPCSSCCTAYAAVSPAKFPPSTSTFLRVICSSRRSSLPLCTVMAPFADRELRPVLVAGWPLLGGDGPASRRAGMDNTHPGIN